MFSLSPGSGGTQGREAGRPAPRRNPFRSPQPRWLECAQQRPRIDSVAVARRGPGKQNPDLTGPAAPGKFYQVAPQRGREARLRCALDP